jgi:hypothetical protein
MNSLDALRKMVDHYPGGRAAVAARLGKVEEVLRKELSGATSHKLGVVDATSIAEMCAEAKSQHASAYANGLAALTGAYIALPVREMTVGKQDLRQEAASLLKEGTDVLQELTVALADEAISDNELHKIEREVGDVFERLQSLLRGVKANNAASKPAHLRAA